MVSWWYCRECEKVTDEFESKDEDMPCPPCRDEMRQVCSEPISCEHCGYLPDEFVEYFDGCGWCPACAYANGLIGDDQLRQDQEDSDAAQREWLKRKLDKLAKGAK